jgi:adenosylcobyric acid synthase
MADLAFLRAQGWDIDLHAHLRRGGRVLGLCGGYQMLGKRISDPAGVEGGGVTPGLGLLDVETMLEAEKITSPTTARHMASGEKVHGYEIHLGRTFGPDCARPLFAVGRRPEGAISADGQVSGTYLHGIFAADGFRAAFLAALGTSSAARYEAEIENAIDAVADAVEGHLDLDRVLRIARREI